MFQNIFQGGFQADPKSTRQFKSRLFRPGIGRIWHGKINKNTKGNHHQAFPV